MIQTQAITLIGFDIGGGTPSFAQIGHIASLLEAVRRNFILPPSVAISIETTPKIAAASPEKLQAYYDLGIRRISMGVQTINPHLLTSVGRNATSIDFNRQAVAHIRRAGFTRFNIDVMYGFAGQSLGGIEATLQHVIELNPEYITLYRMRYKGTRLAHQMDAISRDAIQAQADLASQLLHSAGYGVADHDAPGKNTFSRLPGDPGTSDYLTKRVVSGTPYLGLGLGAQSLSQFTLSYNSGAADKRLDHYQRQVDAGRFPIQDLYHLSSQVAMAKMISVSFYFGEINRLAFQSRFGLSLEQAFPAEVQFVLEQGLMEYSDAIEGCNLGALTLRLTSAGAHQFNGVIALFYAGAVKAHLLEKVKNV
jgi:oxygen-independent coproporphyrinogen-3 oxidase